METLYSNDISTDRKDLFISGSEIKHIKALRLKPGSEICVVDGKGTTALCRVVEFDRDRAVLEILSLEQGKGELPVELALAIGMLDNRDRLEFALEKAVELGAADFCLLDTQFSQKRNVNYQRLEMKALAAMKQCGRSQSIRIHHIQSISSLLQIHDWKQLILADYSGVPPDSSLPNKESTLAIIGPEGGFSNEELNIFSQDPRTIIWSLGSRRLRAETAAISMLSYISVHLESFI